MTRILLIVALLIQAGLTLGDCPDGRRPDAPPLAEAGAHEVGVGEFLITSRAGDRDLALSVWYPAVGNGNGRAVYRDALGSGPGDPERPVVPFEFCSQAWDAAQPAKVGNPLPTVLISHGFPGSNVLMAWLSEHLASHGFAVVGINHTGATHADRGEFADVLVNKPSDILAVLDAIGSGDLDLDGVALNGDRVGLAGYSMGGYAALVAAGASLDPRLAGLPALQGIDVTPWLSAQHAADPRIAAVVGLAPWGGPEALERVGFSGLSLWRAEAMRAIEAPLLLISGDADLISGYQGGARWIFEHVTQPRWLLTYHQARHNVAPMPPPVISRQTVREFNHYAEPVWDIERLNDLNRHFILSFFRAKLLADLEALAWLSPHRNGTPKPPGFAEREAIGFSLERRGMGE